MAGETRAEQELQEMAGAYRSAYEEIGGGVLPTKAADRAAACDIGREAIALVSRYMQSAESDATIEGEMRALLTRAGRADGEGTR